MVDALKPGEALLLENLRFHREEEANDRDFSHELARGKQVYVNDAFGTAHRAHASTVGVTRFLAERAAGFLMMRELEALRAVTDNPAHPYIAILGGAKVSDKIGVIRNLLNKVDAILIGGAMAYTFLKARGTPIGMSRVEEDKLDLARELLAEAAKRNIAFVLPLDHVVAATLEAGAVAETVIDIPSDRMGLDIGPRTVLDFVGRLAGAKTVIWNGPLGLFETRGICPGHAESRRGDRQSGGRHQRDRRRRYGGGGGRCAVGEPLHAHLDRRRRDAGVPRGHRIAGREGTRREAVGYLTSPPLQFEDLHKNQS